MPQDPLGDSAENHFTDRGMAPRAHDNHVRHGLSCRLDNLSRGVAPPALSVGPQASSLERLSGPFEDLVRLRVLALRERGLGLLEHVNQSNRRGLGSELSRESVDGGLASARAIDAE
jgi:hypothetical protein